MFFLMKRFCDKMKQLNVVTDFKKQLKYNSLKRNASLVIMWEARIIVYFLEEKKVRINSMTKKSKGYENYENIFAS